MKAKPSIDAFIGAGAADKADQNVTKKAAPVAVTARVQREQKVFRLPLDLINTLKREAYERSMTTGKRVTETEMIEEALRNYFK